MKKKITIEKSDAFLFLVSAVRYALGRRSYIVGWACEQVRAIAPHLENFQRQVIVESICRCEDFGDKYNEKEWLKLLNWLLNYDDARKTRKKKAKR